MAFVLRAVCDVLGEDRAGQAAARALDLVRSRFDGERWPDQFELLGGNAGIALGAARAGDLDLAVLALTPYLATAEATAGGVHWEVRAGTPARFHHLSHGTLGIVYALAAIGHAAGRRDLTDLALAGAADVVSRDEAGPDGFLVPHSDPQHKRLRPGFWDNNGRCCGTAGVLALACDRHAEEGDGLSFAGVLASDLAARATVDNDGARWSNYEHRASPRTLAPRTGWAMGNAGIIRELLRYARLCDQRDPSYAVAWPDHPPAARSVNVVHFAPSAGQNAPRSWGIAATAGGRPCAGRPGPGGAGRGGPR